MFKIYDYEMTKTIAEIEFETEARIFAKHYSKGSEDIPSRDVWVYRVEGMEGEKAIAGYFGGTCFDRMN